MSTSKKIVLVTGGSRGLGLHAASGSVVSPLSSLRAKVIVKANFSIHNRFLQAGCSKVYITSRKAAACASACEALNALPTKRPGAVAISVPADSSRMEDLEALVREVGKTTDHVDILFANAGATWGAAFDRHPDGAFGHGFECEECFQYDKIVRRSTFDDVKPAGLSFGAKTLCEIGALAYDLI